MSLYLKVPQYQGFFFLFFTELLNLKMLKPVDGAVASPPVCVYVTYVSGNKDEQQSLICN